MQRLGVTRNAYGLVLVVQMVMVALLVLILLIGVVVVVVVVVVVLVVVLLPACESSQPKRSRFSFWYAACCALGMTGICCCTCIRMVTAWMHGVAAWFVGWPKSEE